jgi:hypothetical protein
VSASHRSQRAAVADRLRECRPEIEQAVLARSAVLLEETPGLDAEFIDGQRVAVATAVNYGIDAIELGEERMREVPALFHAQARLNARCGVALDTMMRRYFAGYVLLGDYLMREADGCSLGGAVLQCIMRDTAAVFDRLVSTMAEEYLREARARHSTPEERMAARVRALLRSEILEAPEIDYRFEAWHLGAVASGSGAHAAVRVLARQLDRRLLAIRSDEDAVWAWFGGRGPLEADELAATVTAHWPEGLDLALGDPAVGMAGWRQTHRQAQAVFPIARRSEASYVTYGDAAMLASVLQDDLYATSLRERYLAPLASERDGGATLRATVRAFFSANRNVSSAAAALGVGRHAVTNRLRVVEEKIGQPLTEAGAEFEAALRLHELHAGATDEPPTERQAV